MTLDEIHDIVCDQIARDIQQVSFLFKEYSCDNLPQTCRTIAERIHAELGNTEK